MILPDLITQHAKEHPDHIAFIYRDQKTTYGELEQKILQCARGLHTIGVRKGNTFGLLLRNSPDFVILAMALSKVGAIAIPINFLEKPDRIALILNDAKAIGILTQKEFLNNVQAAVQKTPSIQHVFLKDNDQPGAKPFQSLFSYGTWDQGNSAEADDLMMLLYTSGTIGLPKGVMLTHRNFLVNLDQCLNAINLSAKDRFLCLLPLFHSFSWTTCMLIPLKLGVPIVIIESLLPFDPVIKAIWKYKITLFVAVPQIYSALTSKIQGAAAFFIRFLNPVRLCISGAAPLPAAIHQNFEKTFGISLLEGYGLTETAPVVSLNPERKRKVGTVGIPLPGVQVQICDDRGKPVSTGEVGEICVRGDNVMKGYYNKPEETAEVLTKDGWLKTGDLGKLDDEGYLTIVDRKKDLIIVKGLNVYPQEVEAVIAKAPGVKEVAVVGKVDKETGDELIRAFITIQEGATVDKAQIFSLCRQELAAYKRPRDIIVINEMPKNALQKILKKELRERP